MNGKWKLLEPVLVGTMRLRNRMVMAPMESRLNRPDGSVTQRLINYYAERAKGGVGLIIVQNCYIDDKESRGAIIQMGVYSDHLIAGLNELAEAIQSYGAAAILQISHDGNQCNPEATGRQPVAPSPIPSKAIGVMPREASLADVEEIQKAFAEAARRAKQAGFDGVEIHGGHGYLIGEFLSPYTNKRTDKYGGGLENRARFPLEVVNRVREKVGSSFTVGYRISADEYIPGGLTVEETGKFAKMLEKARIDYIHVTAGTYESMPVFVPPNYTKKGSLIHLAEGIKKSVEKVPVITVCALDVEIAEKVLKEGKADLAAFGRALITDPELPKKVAEGRIGDIRPCVRGNEGCISRFFTGATIRCEVNPACGREAEFRINPTDNKKKVMVIGGGIAGMEAARIAAMRGHDVTLIEKADKLGGHIIEACVPEFKDEVGELLNWAIKQVKDSNVKIDMNTEATPEFVKEAKPDVLIIAVGSDFLLPPVPGCNRPCVAGADEVLLGKRSIGDKVVVVGAGLIGAETALYIADELKKKVTVIEMLDEIVPENEPVSRLVIIDRLAKAGIEVHTGWTLTEIKDNAALCKDKQGQVHKIETNTLVLATGLVAKKDLVQRFNNLAPAVYVIGDCQRARKIYNCFEDAWRAALTI
jgi:2,4-dienoyl-CoA reductase-like NADH-dependent reductase (Old Yellow Enzyme family)/thioredoxin reductase